MNKVKINNLDNHFIEKLNNSKFYKLDFGMEDFIKVENIELLIFLACLTGFSAVDVSAEKDFILKANNAINNAIEKLKESNIKIVQRPLLFTSFKKDHFSNLNNEEIFEKLGFFKTLSIDVIDLHLNETDLLKNLSKIDLICNFFEDKIISINLSRKSFSNAHMVELLEKISGSSKGRLLIEIEGMEFYKDDYSLVLQTVSTADIINKQFKSTSPKYKKIPILLGNYSNGNVEQLARECCVSFNGISINHGYLKNLINNKLLPYRNEEINELSRSIRKNLFKNI